MSDWKSRANPVSSSGKSDWKSRAVSIGEESKPENDLKDTLESFGVGVTQSIPVLGSYANNISAAGAKGLAKLDDLIHGTNNAESPAFDYAKMRDELNRRDEELKKEHPYAMGAGTVTGMGAQLGLALAPGGTGAVTSKLPVGNRVLAAGKYGAISSALSNPGDTEGKIDDLQLGKRAQNAAEGFVTGAATEKLLGALPKILSSAGKSAGSKAEENAFEALRGYKKDVKNALSKQTKEALGREILDTGIIGNVPKSVDTLAERAIARKEQSGKIIGKMIDDLDQTLQGGAVNKKGIGKEIYQELRPDRLLDPGNKAKEKLAARVRALVASDKPLTLKGAQELKRKAAEGANFNKNTAISPLTDKEKYFRSLYSKLNKAIDQGADVAAEAKGGDSLKNALQEARGKYQKRKLISDILEARSLGDEVNRAISPSDYGVGLGTFMATGDPVTGTALGLANKGVRKYGSQISAKQLDNISKALEFSGDALRKRQKLNALEMLLLGNLNKGGASLPTARASEDDTQVAGGQ